MLRYGSGGCVMVIVVLFDKSSEMSPNARI